MNRLAVGLPPDWGMKLCACSVSSHSVTAASRHHNTIANHTGSVPHHLAIPIDIDQYKMTLP